MKKIFLLLFLLGSFNLGLSAQNMQEVVYLKNGSIIKGVVIEQIPGESLKIQTYDGSIFVYKMSEVEKITKESTLKKTHDNANEVQTTNNIVKKGYKGFADMAYCVGIGEFGDDVFSISTTHGYQFNPYFFLGAGVALNAHLGYETFFMPLYANARFNFINKRISPFISTKLGYSVTDGTGLYQATDFGASFIFRKKFGLYVSMGYALQQSEIYYYYGSYEYGYDTEILGSVSFKVGLEF